jgi:hypothetical protein
MGIKSSAEGRALAARRPVVETTCAVCGAPIAGTRKRRYCGNACTLRAWRERKALEPAIRAILTSDAEMLALADTIHKIGL